MLASRATTSGDAANGADGASRDAPVRDRGDPDAGPLDHDHEPAGAKHLTAAVALVGVSKRYGDVEAVRDFTLEVEPGELLVLLGPSGCGKSTVLRLVAGLEHPSEGTVLIGGTVVNDVDPKDRDVAMVFQSYALYPHLSVRQNIEFPLRSRRAPARRRRELVDEVARGLQLERLLDRKPAQLSGGQRQRVALARAIVRRPAAFLLDEPLSNLDAQLRLEMRAELVELHARLGTTSIYVTHDQVEATTMGQRIAVMHEGRLQQVGAPRAVYERPANAFVAGFVGHPPMNIVPARIGTAELARTGARAPGSAGAGAGWDAERYPSGPSARAGESAGAAIFAGGEIVLSPELVARVRRRNLDHVLVGIRPEDLHPDPKGAVSATVSLVEDVAGYQQLSCRLGTGQLVGASAIAGGPVFRTGEAITLSALGEPHLFDPSNGERVDS